MSLDLLLDDGVVLALNKPSGLSTQSPPGFDSLERRVRELLATRHVGPGRHYLGVPHRLDRPVSGVILFAPTPRAARKLARQFEKRSIAKTYWAAVQSVPDPPEGTWRDLMRKIPDEPRAEIVSPNLPDAREAVLHYRTIGRTAHGAVGDHAGNRPHAPDPVTMQRPRPSRPGRRHVRVRDAVRYPAHRRT
ncbi:MAG: RNA pseudouridine synthase [Pirellulales bacterium]